MTLSIQQRLYPESTCFGCGPANPQGLQVSSFRTDDGVVGTFTPAVHHSNGMGSLNGGIIATALDCHSGAAVLAEAAAESGALTDLWVTAGLELRYRLPTYLDGPCELSARIIERDTDAMLVSATLSSGGKVRVQAQSRWARVRPKR